MFFNFNVFQDVSGLLTLNSNEGQPPRPFHSLVLVKGGSCFSILKANNLRRPPLTSNSDPPLGGKVCLQKHPQMRGTPGSARVPIKNAIF